MRFALLALVLLSGSLAEARRPIRVRRSCATAGMSCTPGPCCKGLSCDGVGVCRKPEDGWKRNINEPGPDDTAEVRKKRAEQNQAKK